MTNVALKELTKEAVSLPYEEQKELFESLSISIRTIEAQKPHKTQKTKEEIRAFLDSFRGSSHCWDGLDPVDYQRKIREEREIVQPHIS